MLAISLRSGVTRNPKHLLAGTSLGFDCMKKSKYISEDERGGFVDGVFWYTKHVHYTLVWI
jgi:hypothetical protein